MSTSGSVFGTGISTCSMPLRYTIVHSPLGYGIWSCYSIKI